MACLVAVEYVCVDFAAAHPILRTVRPAMELALPKVATVGCLRLLLGRETSVVLGCESGELLEDATMLRTLPGVRIELPNSARIKVRFRGCAKAAAASLAAKPHSALTTAPFELSDFDAFCARFSQQAVAYLADPVLQFHLALVSRTSSIIVLCDGPEVSLSGAELRGQPRSVRAGCGCQEAASGVRALAAG